jgi:hypothetical protein
MAKKYTPVDLSKLKTYSVRRRAHRCDVRGQAGLPPKGATFRQWWEALPAFLGAVALNAVAQAIVDARRAGRPVVFAMGAHVVKVGCAPVVCDLIERGLVTAVAMNGATAIHDIELAMFGETSEEVADTIRDGRFGMVRETPAFFVEALAAAKSPEAGLGAVLGDHLLAVKPPHARHSILAAARRADIPATVHVAVGTDTIHMHERVAASSLTRRSEIDFRIICSVAADLAPESSAGKGRSAPRPAGVWCNIGSAVVLPEVFLKAVAVARNLGANLDEITTANFDMLRHYRPSENVIGRPVKKGRGHHVAGQHEILLPLLRQVLVELSGR